MPAASARRGVEPDDGGGERDRRARSRAAASTSNARRGSGEDRREPGPRAGERERDPDEAVTGRPTSTAASKSCAIASSARPKRVRCRSSAHRRGERERRDGDERASAAGSCAATPERARRRTAAGRGRRRRAGRRRRRSSVRTANATAREAPTQPITEPRARYGSIARKYEPALAAAVTTSPTTSATGKRAPPTLVCETGPEPAATSSVTKTPSCDQLAECEVDDARSAGRRSSAQTATRPYTAPAANPVARIWRATATTSHSRLRSMTLRLSSAGESHGPALVAIVSGLPAGLELDRAAIDADLKRRQEGYGRSPRQQIEQDRVEVLAGLRHGRTLGTPLALVVRNVDHKNWTWGMAPWPPEGEPAGKGTKPVTLPRPGHADLAGVLKYGHDDVRNALERASARHTAVHVAAGAVAKALLATIGIAVRGVDGRRGGTARADRRGARRARHGRRGRRGARDRRAARASAPTPRRKIASTRGSRRRVMGIQAVKGVEIGDGFALAALRGSEAHDEIGTDRRRDTNHAGGIEGGISNGEEIVVRAAMKPLPTLMKPLGSVDLETGQPRRCARRALRRRRGRGARGRRRVGGRLGARGRRAGEVRRRRGRRLRGRARGVRRAHRMGVAGPSLNALDRHLALVGFMGAGKTTLGPRGRASGSTAVRRRSTGRSRAAGSSRSRSSSRARRDGVPDRRGGASFGKRSQRAEPLGDRARRRGGHDRRGARRARASTRSPCCVDVDVETAWARVARQRPPARAGRGASFARLLRASGSRSTARSPTRSRTDVDGVVLAAAGVHHELGALERLGELVPGDGPGRARRRLDGARASTAPRAQTALGDRLRLDARAPARRGGEAAARRRAALGGAAPRPRRHGRRARRRLH